MRNSCPFLLVLGINSLFSRYDCEDYLSSISVVKFRFFSEYFSDFFHINSDFVSDQSGRSAFNGVIIIQIGL